MTAIPEDLRYTEDHEWVLRLGPARVRIGITDYAQSQLGDVVFVERPPVGSEVDAGQGVMEVESVKAVSQIYVPVKAKVVAVNELLDEEPELLNTDPYGDGWLLELEVADSSTVDSALAELLDAAGYQGVIGG